VFEKVVLASASQFFAPFVDLVFVGVEKDTFAEMTLRIVIELESVLSRLFFLDFVKIEAFQVNEFYTTKDKGRVELTFGRLGGRRLTIVDVKTAIFDSVIPLNPHIG
jgi:hypothetical protein